MGVGVEKLLSKAAVIGNGHNMLGLENIMATNKKEGSGYAEKVRLIDLEGCINSEDDVALKILKMQAMVWQVQERPRRLSQYNFTTC